MIVRVCLGLWAWGCRECIDRIRWEIIRSPEVLRSCNGLLWMTCHCILFCLLSQKYSWQSIFYVLMDVCVEYFVNELVSGYRVEGHT